MSVPIDLSMLEQLAAAPDLLTNAVLAQQAYAYFETLKSSDDGWVKCMEILSRSIDIAAEGGGDAAANDVPPNDQLEFLCLQVMEDFIRSPRYRNAPNPQAVHAPLESFMTRWLNRYCAKQRMPPTYLRNKLATFFAAVFVNSFLDRWPKFLDSLFLGRYQSCRDSLIFLDFYLRFLLSVDSEIAEREIQRTKDEDDRNTQLKDRMRDTSVVRLVQSWHGILSSSVPSMPEAATLCLNVIGAFIAWIDISLIANDQFIPLIVGSFAHPDIQEASADCICSILAKKMEPGPKLRLVHGMDRVLAESGVFTVDGTAMQDSELMMKLAELIDCIGTELIGCYQKSLRGGEAPEVAEQTMKLLDGKVVQMIALLNLNDSDVSSAVYEFAHQYLGLLKTIPGGLTDDYKNRINQILSAVLQNYRFPDDYNHDKEGENEATFMEFRKELKILFLNVVQLDPDLALGCVEQMMAAYLPNWQAQSYRDLELSITLLFFLGEALPTSHGNLFTSSGERSVKLRHLVGSMVQSGVIGHGHAAVTLQYFETVARYDRLFAMEPTLIPVILDSFLDERGLRHPSPTVRSRCAYLISRFIKTLKPQVHKEVGGLLTRLAPLVATEPAQFCQNFQPEDMLFLYETIGNLIVSSQLPTAEKRAYMEQILADIWQKISANLPLVTPQMDDQERTKIFDYLNSLISCASRISKAFSNQLTMKTCECTDLFTHMMQFLLESLAPSSAPLLNGIRQYLHRMVICLENEMLPFIHKIVGNFLAVIQDSRGLQDFLILLQQMVSKYKAEIVVWLQPEMAILTVAVWTMASRPIDTTDSTERADRQYLRRAYLQLLSCMLSNGAVDLVAPEDPVNREYLLQFILGTISDPSDPTAQKQAVTMSVRLLEEAVKPRMPAAAAGDGCTTGSVNQDATANGQSKICATGAENGSKPIINSNLAWCLDFVRLRALPEMLSFCLQSKSDIADAQITLVIYEIGSAFKKVYQIQGDPFLEYLSGTMLAQSVIPSTACDQLIFTLKTSEGKLFQRYFKTFILDLRNTIASNNSATTSAS